MKLLILMLVALSMTAAANIGSIPEQKDNATPILFVFDKDFAPYTYEENGSIKALSWIFSG